MKINTTDNKANTGWRWASVYQSHSSKRPTDRCYR